MPIHRRVAGAPPHGAGFERVIGAAGPDQIGRLLMRAVVPGRVLRRGLRGRPSARPGPGQGPGRSDRQSGRHVRGPPQA